MPAKNVPPALLAVHHFSGFCTVVVDIGLLKFERPTWSPFPTTTLNQVFSNPNKAFWISRDLLRANEFVVLG